ncbi:uncharacterized protein [Maniola hyperantus]|uniref:uncharacterized protein n=1 Tax=Aphantopus hyperantus TaxID=2795564 RepID=UPI00374929AB
MVIKCHGCNVAIYDLSFMECAHESCKKIYHLKCLLLTDKQYEEYTEEFKANWSCPECTRDAPKGNNSDTPVRGAVMNKTFTPSACYVTKERGNRIVLDDSRIGMEEKLLEELKDFRWEMKSRLEKQSKEYAQLLDRFNRTESELQEMKQSMKLVLEKVSKVDLLESKLKVLLARNEFLENALHSEKKKEVRSGEPEVGQSNKLPVQSFVDAVKQNQNKVVLKKCEVQRCEAMKPAEAKIIIVEEKGCQVIEEKTTTGKEGNWTEVKSKRNRYPTQEVKRGGSAQAIIEGTEKKKYLHVWRLRKDTTVEKLEQFVQEAMKEEVPVKIEKIKHKTERDYSSFIIGVPESKYDILCQSEVWPVNVEFCEWVWFRRAASRSTRSQDAQ